MSSASLGVLSVRIAADTSGVKRGLKQTDAALARTSDKLRANSKQWIDWNAKTMAAVAALSIGTVLAARKVVDYADTFTSMTNKLKLATSGTEDLANVTAKMFSIADQTRTSVEATTDLYTKMERSTRSLDISQDRLLAVTSSVNKAFAIGGATAQETSGSIRQLGQALASGTLRGDEFNSIAEQAPIIMEAVSAATGKTAGELRELAADGAISAAVLIESLERYADKIERDFSTSIATYSQKTEQASNIAIEFVSKNEKLKNAVTAAGDGVLFLAENLGTLVTVVETAATIYGAVLVGSLVKATAAKTAGTRAAVALAISESRAAQAAAATAVANRTAAVSALAVAKAEQAAALAMFKAAEGGVAATVASNTLAAANSRLATASAAVSASAATVATTANAATVATGRLSVASAVAGRAMAGLRAGMALLGGPVGILITVAASLALFVDWETDAEKQTKRTNTAIDDQTEALGKLSSISAITAKMKEFSDAAVENEFKLMALREELAGVTEEIIEATTGFASMGGSTRALTEKTNEAAALEAQIRTLEESTRLAAEGFKQLESALQGKTEEKDGEKQGKIDLDKAAQDEKDKQTAERAAKRFEAEKQRLADLAAMRAEDTAFQVERIKERFMTEEQLEIAAFALEMERVREHYAGKAELKAEQDALEKRMQEEHSQNLIDIKQREEDIKRRIMETATTGLLGLLAASGKKGAKIAQKAAKLRAIIAGKEAAVHAWDAGMSTGGPWAPIVAAGYAGASLLKTGAMISGLGGGGGGSVGGGGGGGSAAAGGGQGAAASAAPAPAQDTTRRISVDLLGDGLLSTAQVRALLGQINEQLGDGVELNTGG